MGVCESGVAQFLCSIPVDKIQQCGIAVTSNPTVCDVCIFKQRCSVKRNYLRCCCTRSITTVFKRTMGYGQWLCDVFAVQKIVKVMALIVLYQMQMFSLIFKKPHRPH